MFNKTIIGRGDVHHTHTTNEHRAPTDDSIRLLREMEEKSNDHVLWKSGQVELNNFLVCEAVVIRDPMIHHENPILRCRYYTQINSFNVSATEQELSRQIIEEIDRPLSISVIRCHTEEEVLDYIKKKIKEITDSVVDRIVNQITYEQLSMGGWDMIKSIRMNG